MSGNILQERQDKFERQLELESLQYQLTKIAGVVAKSAFVVFALFSYGNYATTFQGTQQPHDILARREDIAPEQSEEEIQKKRQSWEEPNVNLEDPDLVFLGSESKGQEYQYDMSN